MMRSGRKPDRITALSACGKSEIEFTHRNLALELVDVERDAHMESVPVDDAVGEDLQLCNAVLRRQDVQPRHLITKVVDANAVNAGIKPADRQTVNQYSISEPADDG